MEGVASDPLVFRREEFDAGTHNNSMGISINRDINEPLLSHLFLALSQAGKHMEDSVLASYSALLVGLLAKHSPVSTQYVQFTTSSQCALNGAKHNNYGIATM